MADTTTVTERTRTFVNTPMTDDLKDKLENHLHYVVCAGQVPLRTVQQAMMGDWVAAASKYNAIPVRQVVTPRRTTARPTPTQDWTPEETERRQHPAGCTTQIAQRPGGWR